MRDPAGGERGANRGAGGANAGCRNMKWKDLAPIVTLVLGTVISLVLLAGRLDPYRKRSVEQRTALRL